MDVVASCSKFCGYVIRWCSSLFLERFWLWLGSCGTVNVHYRCSSKMFIGCSNSLSANPIAALPNYQCVCQTSSVQVNA